MLLGLMNPETAQLTGCQTAHQHQLPATAENGVASGATSPNSRLLTRGSKLLQQHRLPSMPCPLGHLCPSPPVRDLEIEEAGCCVLQSQRSCLRLRSRLRLAQIPRF